MPPAEEAVALPASPAAAADADAAAALAEAAEAMADALADAKMAEAEVEAAAQTAPASEDPLMVVMGRRTVVVTVTSAVATPARASKDRALTMVNEVFMLESSVDCVEGNSSTLSIVYAGGREGSTTPCYA